MNHESTGGFLVLLAIVPLLVTIHPCRCGPPFRCICPTMTFMNEMPIHSCPF
jgi:hypothetical protein